MTSPSAARRRLGTRLAVLWFMLSTAALVWPVYPWLGNRVHPRVLGLPWSLTYVLLVIAANFGALLLLYRLRVVDDREHDDCGHDDCGHDDCEPTGREPAGREPADREPDDHGPPVASPEAPP